MKMTMNMLIIIIRNLFLWATLPTTRMVCHTKMGDRDIARSIAYDKNIFNIPRSRLELKGVDFKRPNYEDPDPDWEKRLVEQAKRREERRKAKESSK